MAQTQSLAITLDCGGTGGALSTDCLCLGQGGFGGIPFSPPVVERIRALRPPLVRIFAQEYFRMMDAPGTYNWRIIDPVLESVKDTGATPLIALCMKPETLFPAVDQTVTTPSSWEEWGAFVTAFVRHCADDLDLRGAWYEVANEPDLGEGGGCPYLFTPEGYADYYARTAAAVRAGDASAKVGGPALSEFPDKSPFPNPLAARVTKDGLPFDFFSWHIYNTDSGLIAGTVTSTITMLKNFGEPFASAATVLGEWNIVPVCNVQVGEYLQAAFAVDAMARLMDAGLDYAFYYHIMDADLPVREWNGWFSPEGIERMNWVWNSAYRGLHLLTQDGEPAAPYVALGMLREMEGERIPAPRPSPNVGVLASRRDNECRVLLWNYRFEEIRTENVTLAVTGLPAGGFAEERCVLGGNLRDAECPRLVRRGERYKVHEAAHADGTEFRAELTLLPYSVHLLRLKW